MASMRAAKLIVMSAALLAGVSWIFSAQADGAVDNHQDNNTACHRSCDLSEFVERQSSILEMTLGMAYFNGTVVSKDASKAMIWLRKSALDGHTGAAAWLGHMLNDGLGVAVDHAEAARYFRIAAYAGNNAYAQNNLAYLLLTGSGVERDEPAALLLYTSAGNQGDAAAQVAVGSMYQNGQGTDKNYETALVWYRRAAEHNRPEAWARVGYLYENGLGVARDYASAMTWYRNAAAKGNGYAAARLGWMYQSGLGVAKDYQESLRWYRQAQAAGNHSSQGYIDSICKQRASLEQSSGQSSAGWGCPAGR